MRKTLLYAILAAFAAIPAVALSMEGCGMNLGARIGCWSGGKLSAKSYVQDGLIHMWDGIENVGWGKHNSSATVWVDLVGGNNMTIVAGSWGDDEFNADTHIPGTNYMSTIGDSIISSCRTKELVFLNKGIDGTTKQTLFELGVEYGFSYVIPVSGREYVQMAYSGYAPIVDYNSRNSVSAVLNSTMANSDRCFCNGERITTKYTERWGASQKMGIGRYGYGQKFSYSKYNCIRLYSRVLTDLEIAHNYAVDKARFGLT